MHRIFIFLERRPDLDRAALHFWWLKPHRALVEKVPGLRRYTASLEAAGEEGPFDGVAELWFDDASAAATALRSSPGQVLDADMRAHAKRMERLDLVAHELFDTGLPSPFKLLAALKRRADLTRAEFASWWLERHAPMVVAFPQLRRYCVNIVADESERFVDGIAEVAFADLETLKAITSSAQVKSVQGDSQVHTSARYRMLVEERVLIR
jgi:uncharacterized protein (TIGR02118 family)